MRHLRFYGYGWNEATDVEKRISFHSHFRDFCRGYDYDDYDRYSPPYRDRYRRSPSPRYYDDRHRRRSRSYDRDRDYY